MLLLAKAPHMMTHSLEVDVSKLSTPKRRADGTRHPNSNLSMSLQKRGLAEPVPFSTFRHCPCENWEMGLNWQMTVALHLGL